MRGEDVESLDAYLHFKKGLCDYQKVSLDCDSCFEKVLHHILKRKSYHWQFIGNDKYLSKYSRKLLLTKVQGEHYFDIRRIDITEDEYRKMLTQAGTVASK